MSPPLSVVSLDILPHASCNCNISISVVLGHESFIAMDCLAWLNGFTIGDANQDSATSTGAPCASCSSLLHSFFQRFAAEPVN